MPAFNILIFQIPLIPGRMRKKPDDNVNVVEFGCIRLKVSIETVREFSDNFNRVVVKVLKYILLQSNILVRAKQ
jgi:hypothetical protein